MSSRAAKVEGVLKEAESIRQTIEDLAHNQDTALLTMVLWCSYVSHGTRDNCPPRDIKE